MAAYVMGGKCRHADDRQRKPATSSIIRIILSIFFLTVVIVLSRLWYPSAGGSGTGVTTWTDCTDPVTRGADVMSLSIDPSPIRIPGNVSIGIGMRVMRSLKSPAPASIRIMKRISFFWIDLPCINGFGTCDYDNLCSLWPFFDSCPTAFTRNNIPCSCPFAAGEYDLPEQDMVQIFPDSSTPSWLESGYYWAQVRIFDSRHSDGSYLCNELYVSVYAS